MAKRGTWYSMQQAGAAAEIHIYDTIGTDFFGEGVGAKSFIDDLAQFAGQDLSVRINSPGGQVFEGVAIHNALARHDALVNVHIDGMALSIASLIAMAGDTINIAENGIIMIHDPWTWVQGNAADMRKEAENLDRVKEGMLSSYQQKTGIDRGELAELMAEETWYGATEALDAGFADQITEPQRIAACFDLSKFHYRNTPMTASTRAKVVIAGIEDRL